MATNLEIKIKLPNHRKVLNKIGKIGALEKGILKQKDIYYKSPAGLLKLRVENGRSALIYYNRDEKGKKRWSEYEVLPVDNKAEKVLPKFLKVIAVVKKERKLFIYKSTRIHLDSVTGLGKFLELETVVGKSKKEAEKRFKEMVELLSLDVKNQIKKSYYNLITQK